MEITLYTQEKDAANPLSHQEMASLNFFNRTQALAPVKKTSTAQPPRIWAANATIPQMKMLSSQV